MIGTQGTSAFRCADDFTSHKDYLNYMYANTKGFITRSVIPAGKVGGYYEAFAYADRLINRNKYFGVDNVYVSMNTFLSKRNDQNPKSGRKVENLKALNALYLDLDCYKIGLSQEQVLFELEDRVFGSKIPHPTFVINSGRGMYLIWKIAEDRNALPRWNRVQKYLFEQCRDFNADPQAIDAARILRVPFSRNSKNGQTVKIMAFNDVSYTLHEIITEYNIPAAEHKKRNTEEVYPYGEATARQRRVAQWQASEFGLELPDFSNYQETFDFIKANSRTHGDNRERRNNTIIFAKAKTIAVTLDGRVNDLFKLFSMRKGADCSREYALFLCRLWTAERSNDFDYAVEKTLALNSSLDVPFDEKYVLTRTKSAETKLKNGETYKYSLSKLIEVLGISEEEQRELQYLCANPQSEAARRKKSNRRAYLSRLEKAGESTKQDKVAARRNEIAKALAEGKTKASICAALNISARTYDRDKAYIVAHGMIERVKDAMRAAEAAVKAAADTARDKIKETAQTVTEAAKEAARSAINAASDMASRVSPFFQSINYERNTVGVSGCGSAALKQPVYVQLTLWDLPWFNSS